MSLLDRCRFIPTGDYVPALRSFLARWEAIVVEDAEPLGVSTELCSCWRLRDGTELWRVEAVELGAEYFVLSGVTIDAALDDLHAVMPFWTIDQLGDAWDAALTKGEVARMPALVLAMGLLGPERPDVAVAQRIVAALAHEDPAVREHAVLAAGLLGWRKLGAALAERRRIELHPAVQDALDRFPSETPLHSGNDA